jgi:hypothetical protein
MDFYHMPALVSLAVIIGILAVAVTGSILKVKRDNARQLQAETAS